MKNFKKILSESLNKVATKLNEGAETYYKRLKGDTEAINQAQKIAKRIEMGGDYKNASLDWIGPYTKQGEDPERDRRKDILDLATELAIEEYVKSDDENVKNRIIQGLFTAYGFNNKFIHSWLKGKYQDFFRRKDGSISPKAMQELEDNLKQVYDDYPIEKILKGYLASRDSYDGFGKYAFIKIDSAYKDVMRRKKKDVMSGAQSLDEPTGDDDNAMRFGDTLAGNIGIDPESSTHYDPTGGEVPKGETPEVLSELLMKFVENIQMSELPNSGDMTSVIFKMLIEGLDKEEAAADLNMDVEEVNSLIADYRTRPEVNRAWNDAIKSLKIDLGGPTSPLYDAEASEMAGEPMYSRPLPGTIEKAREFFSGLEFVNGRWVDPRTIDKKVVEPATPAVGEPVKAIGSGNRYASKPHWNSFRRAMGDVAKAVNAMTGSNWDAMSMRDEFIKGEESWSPEFKQVINQIVKPKSLPKYLNKAQLVKKEMMASNPSVSAAPKEEPKSGLSMKDIIGRAQSGGEVDFDKMSPEEIEQYYAYMQEQIGIKIMKNLLN